MKKILLIVSFIYLMFIYSTNSAYSSDIQVEELSSSIKYQDKISIPIMAKVQAQGDWHLYVEAVTPEVVNQSGIVYNIPLSRFEIRKQSGEAINNFGQNRSFEIASSKDSNSNNLSFLLNASVYNSEPAGNYPIDLKFTLKSSADGESQVVKIFNFKQDELSSIEFSQPFMNVELERDKILRKNETYSLPDTLGVRVQSNTNWKLYVRKLSQTDKDYKYFIGVNAADKDVKTDINGNYIQIGTEPVLIAEGKPTANFGEMQNQYKDLNILYLIRGEDGKFIKSGVRTADFEYRLENQ